MALIEFNLGSELSAICSEAQARLGHGWRSRNLHPPSAGPECAAPTSPSSLLSAWQGAAKRLS